MPTDASAAVPNFLFSQESIIAEAAEKSFAANAVPKRREADHSFAARANCVKLRSLKLRRQRHELNKRTQRRQN